MMLGALGQLPTGTDTTATDQAQQCQNLGLLGCFLPNCMSGGEFGSVFCIPVWAGMGILLLFLLMKMRSS